MGLVRLITGSAASSRAARIDRLFLEAAGRACLLTPTRASARARQAALIDQIPAQAIWGAPVLEFSDFVEALLASEGARPRRLGDLERRLLLEHHALAAVGDMGDRAFTANSGIANHLLRTITQLKQEALEPAEFRARLEKSGQPGPADNYVAAVYEAYQESVKASGAFDVPGLYWEAFDRGSRGPLAMLQGLDAILLDGFDDFTPSQLRLLKVLSAQTSLLAIGLNYDDRPERADCFAGPARVAATIRETLGAVVEGHDGPVPASHSAFAAQALFGVEGPALPPSLVANLRLMPCSDGLHEIESIARKVRRLIEVEGAAPARIAVAFRALNTVASSIAATFSHFGIPHRLGYAQPLSQTGPGAFATRLIEAMEAWEREPVTEILTSPWFRPGGVARDSSAVPHLARCAQIVGGADEWPVRLKQLLRRFDLERPGEDLHRLLQRMPDAKAHVQALLEDVTTLKRSADALPQEGSLAQHCAAFDSLLTALGMPQTGTDWPEDEHTPLDRKAIDGLRGLLAQLHGIKLDRSFSRSAFFQILRNGIQSSGVYVGGPSQGVLVCDVAELRNLTFDHVFIGGLNEGVFPKPPAISAVYPEREVGRLQEAGIRLDSHRDHGEREMLLFHHGLAAAEQTLCVSWCLLKSGGREAAPSPYLADLEALFAGGPSIVDTMPRSDSFLPPLDGAASLRELRNVYGRLAPDALKEAGAEGARACDGMAIEGLRNSAEACGNYEGMLTGDQAEAVARRYGADHGFSVSQLESYLACPFQFWTNYVLQIDDTEPPEAEFDHRVRGAILHDALRLFHKKYLGVAVSAIPRSEWDDAVHGCVGEAFELYGWKSVTATRGLVHMERVRMNAVIRRYLEIEAARDDDGLVPAHFEVAFGRAPREGDPLDTDRCFPLNLDEMEVLFTGKIDRIDLGDGEAALIDYKTGHTPSTGDITSGLSLQLTVYAWAVEQMLLPGYHCTEGYYVPVGKEKRQKALGLQSNRGNWAHREANARKAIAEAVRHIRSGFFVPVRARKTCFGCGSVRACRYSQTQMERKGLRPVIAAMEEE